MVEICNNTGAGIDLTSTQGTAVTGSGTANVKGSWTQLVASSNADISFAVINVTSAYAGGNVNSIGVDIAVGASGSEVIIVSNLVFTWYQTGGLNPPVSLPIKIPAGTRISARLQSTYTSCVAYVSLQGFTAAGLDTEDFTGIESIGFTTATSLGTSISDSGTADVAGSWTQMVASTTQAYTGLMTVFSAQDQNNTKRYMIDVAIGASGSEVPIISSIQANAGAGLTVGGISPVFRVYIPAGTRLAARITNHGGGTTCTINLMGVF